MSWRLWQYERQPTNYIDNRTIKRLITSVLLSPVNVHDAYSHEVPQSTKKCYEPTTTSIPESKSTTSSFIIIDKKTKIDDKEEQVEEYQYEDEEDADHYLSDDLYDDDDDDLYDDDEEDEQVEKEKFQAKEENQFIHDFKKTQPRPTTPRRSLLSDLLGRVSSPPPSLLSNSTCSFTTTNSLTEDESSSSSSSTSSASTSSSTTANQNKHNTSKIALNSHPFTNNTNITTNELSEVRWRESFHGW